MNVVFKKTTEEHINILSDSIRHEERLEVYRSTCQTPKEALMRSFRVSSDIFTAIIEDEIVCISGAAPYSMLGYAASPWMLTSEHMKKHPRQLLKYTKLVVDVWRHNYRMLENYVDSDYQQSLRWAKWAGFTIDDPKPRGYRGDMFCRIWMEGY